MHGAPAVGRSPQQFSPVRALSFHASYRCQHRGACCESGWPIPVEAERIAPIQHAVASGQLHAPPGHAPLQFPTGAPSDAPALLAITHRACVFRHASRCDIHAALGPAALPLACRQFPRVCVLDPRGVSVTLSHYCPTARAMLTDVPAPSRIVTDATAFPYDAEYSGLDARAALPPLLRRDVLMDWDSWWHCEALAVDLIANATASPGEAIARLHVAVEETRAWSPSQGPLLSRIDAAFVAARIGPAGPDRHSSRDTSTRRAEIFAAIPGDLATPSPSGAVVTPAIARRLLAAHAFGNWTAHLGGGLRSWLRSLEAVHALIRAGFDVGQVDLLIRHLADPTALANSWSVAES